MVGGAGAGSANIVATRQRGRTRLCFRHALASASHARYPLPPRLERWFYTDWLQQREKRRQRLGKPAASAAAAGSAASPAAASPTATPADASDGGAPSPEDPYTGEHVPYSDDLLRPTVETPTPRFLSLDNPLVATAALLTLVGVVSTLLHG